MRRFGAGGDFIAADGSITIDVNVDTERLKGQLSSLGSQLSKEADSMGALMSQSLTAALNRSVSESRNIGAMVAQGLANGISGGVKAVTNAASQMVEGLKGVITKSVRVQSPSKWAHEVGVFVNEGLAEGITSSAGGVESAAGSLMSMLTDVIKGGAEEIARIDMNAVSTLDAVIEAERRAVEERERTRQLELRQRAIDIAVDSEVKRKAIEHLYATEQEYALKDLEEYRRIIAEKQQAFEEMKKRQAQVVKDISYEEQQYVIGDYELKVKLYDEEYLKRVSLIDEGLYHFLSAKNEEMSAITLQMTLEGNAAAERIAAIIEEKEQLLEKGRVEKERREQKLRDDKEAELLQRILEAETYEQSEKRIAEFNKWREDEEYRLAEKSRQVKIESLNAEYAAIIEQARAAQKEIDEMRKESDAAVAQSVKDILGSTASEGAAMAGNIIDVDAERELLGMSEEQQRQYLANISKAVRTHYDERAKTVASEAAKEFAFVQGHQEGVVTMIGGYAPRWYEAGARLMGSLYDGLSERLYEVNSIVSSLKKQLEKIVSLEKEIGGYSYSGGYYDYNDYGYDVPFYGTGGIVTTPRLAVVGDVPEAIIPLNKLEAVIAGITASVGAEGLFGGVSQAMAGAAAIGAGGRVVSVNQINNIYQPVKSPAEMARELKKVSRRLAESF